MECVGDEEEVERIGFVQVMTDEQMEVLRRQIAAYAAICEQLVEMHKAVTAQQDTIAGMRLGGLYTDSMMTPSGHKITGRQRWTPTSMQLQILENMFDQGIGTPSKQRIKEITLELSHHGQISEANVYNWFQNRRARSKRKQTSQPSNSEPEADADDEASTEKKLKAEIHHFENQHERIDDHQFRGVRASHDLHYLNSDFLQTQSLYPSNESSKSSGSSDQMSYSEHVLSNLGTDNYTRKMDAPGSYIAYQSGERYDMMH